MKILTRVFMVLVLSPMLFGWFFLSPNPSLAGVATDCHAHLEETVLCPASLSMLLESGRALFLVVTSHSNLLLLLMIFTLAGALILSRSLLPLHWFRPVPLRRLREKTYTYNYRFLQELFAKGILHPKLFLNL